MGGRQHQAPGRSAGELRAGPLEIVGFAQDALGDRQHRLARLGQAAEALAAALEDRHPQFLLEQLDLLGNARLRRIQSLGRLRNIQTLALDFDNVTQLLEFHDRPK
jgi:hypothetical protein